MKSPRVIIASGVIGIFALAFAIAGSAGGGQPASGAIASAGPSGTVGVQGAWTIDVLNLDGTVAGHREFHNSLTAGEPGIIAGTLNGDYSRTDWILNVRGSNTALEPCMLGSDPGTCWVTVPGIFPEESTTVFETLSTQVTPSGALRLAGSMIAGRDGDIRTVSSFMDGAGPFSVHEVSPTQPVVAGQQVLITVEFTFVTAP